MSGFGLSTYLFDSEGVPAKWEFPVYDHSLPSSVQRDYDYIGERDFDSSQSDARKLTKTKTLYSTRIHSRRVISFSRQRPLLARMHTSFDPPPYWSSIRKPQHPFDRSLKYRILPLPPHFSMAQTPSRYSRSPQLSHYSISKSKDDGETVPREQLLPRSSRRHIEVLGEG